MKPIVPTILIVFGGLLVLGPVADHTYSNARDKDRIAEFYSRTTNAATLPTAMEPTGYQSYDWACLVAGVCMVVAGVERSRWIPSGFRETTAMK
jgi:hypothetical protein